MIETKGSTEPFKGSAPSLSPNAQQKGVFFFCSGGVPANGSFARLPGKSIRNTGEEGGGAISIYQFGTKVVVQRYTGIEIFDLINLAPNEADFVYDNEGQLIYDNEGIPITA